jgi:hypothetical protein
MPPTIIVTPSERWGLSPPASGKSGSETCPAGVTPTVAVGTGVGGFAGGLLVGGTDRVSVGGGSVGVLVGTVCRAGFCPGAAHRAGPAANPSTSIPNSTSPNVILLKAPS